MGKTKRHFYKSDQDRYSVFVGVKISPAVNEAIERTWPASGRLRTDFIRVLIEEGLKSWRARNMPFADRKD
jgi:hypothetical protein